MTVSIKKEDLWYFTPSSFKLNEDSQHLNERIIFYLNQPNVYSVNLNDSCTLITSVIMNNWVVC